jgi:hypothetical protein
VKSAEKISLEKWESIVAPKIKCEATVELQEVFLLIKKHLGVCPCGEVFVRITKAKKEYCTNKCATRYVTRKIRKRKSECAEYKALKEVGYAGPKRNNNGSDNRR